MGAGSKIPPRGLRSLGFAASIVRRGAKATKVRCPETAGGPCSILPQRRAGSPIPGRSARFAAANLRVHPVRARERGRCRHPPHLPHCVGISDPPLRGKSGEVHRATIWRTKALRWRQPVVPGREGKEGSSLRTVRRGGVLAAGARRQEEPLGHTGERANTGGCGLYQQLDPCRESCRGERPGSPGLRPARSLRPRQRVRWPAAVRSRRDPSASSVPRRDGPIRSRAGRRQRPGSPCSMAGGAPLAAGITGTAPEGGSKAGAEVSRPGRRARPACHGGSAGSASRTDGAQIVRACARQTAGRPLRPREESRADERFTCNGERWPDGGQTAPSLPTPPDPGRTPHHAERMAAW